MTPATKLPNGSRFFEIRFESIGGLGANAGGQVLATAAVHRMGLNAAEFSSYGSEKKGTPIRTFIRLGPSQRTIRTSSPVDAPDVIVVFHDALMKSANTLAGLRADGLLIYNAPAGVIPPALARLPKTARAIRVDALGIANQEKSRPNAVLLGTLSATLPFLDGAAILDTLSEEFQGKHPEAVASNTRAFTRGQKEFETVAHGGEADGDLPVAHSTPAWGWATAPIGGVLPVPGNTAWNDLSTSRTGYMPVLSADACIHCGVCDMVCPDLCLVWTDNAKGEGTMTTRLTGVDYRYCKGCLRCVESCPTGAMARTPETPGLADRLRVPLFPELIK